MFASRERMFSHSNQYQLIDWGNRTSVLVAMRERWSDWYIGPMNNLNSIHGTGFMQVAMGCILIDAISQYVYNLKESDGVRFKKLLNMTVPAFRSVQGLNIRIGGRIIRSASDAMWSGFRCGILYEANASMYCVVNGTGSIVDLVNDLTFDETGQSVPTIVVDPGMFRTEVFRVFDEYFVSLLNQQNFYSIGFNALDLGFREKFNRSFGFKPF